VLVSTCAVVSFRKMKQIEIANRNNFFITVSFDFERDGFNISCQSVLQ
jgi:hypothetical protein